eukprot:CAMPEP_0202388416 /NCGR_PEP_ID=MMETSP1127-20130417/77373_1 /ASSEMBLY_ACC=CAM_ASM_000462 /TAXON_ID=3047 /ORGANISM="Dunaliella tertiolecta, Strain CCMP1320" /LENGTH=79 /DNA_ID=CAMNT_0048989827 /DNA_START=35 /DNA_END=271 /DNA_ORIENTATION=+
MTFGGGCLRGRGWMVAAVASAVPLAVPVPCARCWLGMWVAAVAAAGAHHAAYYPAAAAGAVQQDAGCSAVRCRTQTGPH